MFQVVNERYDFVLTRSWVNTFIECHLDALQTCSLLCQEDTRLTVSKPKLKEHIQMMKIYVDGKFAELIFNLDELGSSDWEDHKFMKVIVLTAVRREDVEGVPRQA
jgi:hypothetical protein